MSPQCCTNATASWLAFASVLAVACALPEFQSYDGSGNNVASPLRGAGGSMILRLVPATTFADANLSMAAGLPGERRVSVELFEQLSNSENAQGVSTITGAWGQFVIHDMMQTSTSGAAVKILPAPVDPKLSSPFYLRRVTRGSGGFGTPINFVSSYLDGSAVYGNSTARVGITQHTGGLMLARADTGLPAGTADVMEAVRPTSWLALAGDRRANNNPGLFSIQGLMVLEHNYWAAAYEVRKSELGLHSAQEVFDMARRRVVAEIQAITYQEYIPAILGAPLPKYTGYKPSVDPSVSVTHVCAASRYGHSGIRSVYPRRDPEGSPHINGPVLLRDAFFDPGEWVLDGGIAPILMGMAMSKEMAVDVAYVNDMRNFLGLGNVPDLSSIDVFRGRDCGVASYADARQHYGLRRPTAMSDLTNAPKLLGALNALYGGDVDKVDFIVGALLERPNGTALVGPLFAAVMRDQYIRTRDGDRFWFENTADARNRFTDDELVDIHSTTLAEIVRRHFPTYSSFPHPAFFFHKSVDKASSGSDAVSGTGTAANTRAEGSVQIDSQLSITWVLDAATFAGTLRLKDVACNQRAWMGMGLGSNMFDADVVLCEWTGSVMQCTDRHASGLEVPAEDTAAQGRDVTLTASSCEDGVLSASFTRPATATDGNADKAFTTGSQPAIFAYKEDSGLAYHGQNRYSLIVDFGSGASVDVSSARDVRRHIVHGVAMFFAWGILAPMGIFVMRFLRHKMYWLTVHQVVMVLTIVIAAVGALGSLAGSGEEPITTHAIMGLVLVSVGVLLGALGSVVKYFHNKPLPPTRYALYRRIHKVVGYCAALLACACLYTGLGDLTHTYQFLMALWLVFLLFGGLMYEWYFNFQGRRKDAIPEAPPLLVKFTARQAVRQVAMGAKWVIMAGRLYDVQNLLDVHPGGSYLLRRCIGADVTSMFNGKTTVDGMVAPHKHTFRAAKLLTTLCVGTLVADDGEDSDSSDAPARPKLPASGSRHSLNANAQRRPAATASHADIARWSGGSDPLADAALGEGSSAQPDENEFHPWTVAHTQWVTAPSRSKPVKLLMLMPPLGSEFEIPFSYRHFGKHMHAQTTLPNGSTRVSPFSLSRWGPANPHTTRMPGSITLLVRRYPKGTVTPVLHGLKAGDTLSLSGPHGLGLRLSSSASGVMIAFAQGSGVVAFLDLVQHMVDQQRSEEDQDTAGMKVEEGVYEMGKRLYDRGETMAGDGSTTPAESRARHHASTSQLNSKSGSIHSSGGGGSNVNLFKARGLRHLRLHLVVLFGTKEDSICLDWLETAAKLAGSRLKVWVNLKQGKPQWAAGGKYRSVGPLQEANLRKILSSAGQDDELHKIWVCGKPDFTQDLFVKLPALGVPIHKINLL